MSVNSESRIKSLDEKGILKTSAVTDRIFNPSAHKVILPDEVKRVTISPEKGQIIISRMNTPLLVGSSSYIDRNYSDLFLPDRLWQTKINENTNSLWLSYVLTWSVTRSRISEIATGTSNSMKNISKKTFLNLKVALPSLNEQKRISDILLSIENKITAEQQSILKLNILKKGLMQSLLTGEVRVQVDEPEVVSS